MLWLCLHLTRLPLDALHAGSPETPLAVIDERQRLNAVNDAAAQRGVSVGMRTATALSLAPELQRRERDRGAEEATLQALAGWCGQFSSWVSLLPPRAVLLEVGGSLRLFGGLEALWRRVDEGAQALGLQARLGCAPTPTGAALLARSARHRCRTTHATLRETVRDYPLETLDWDAKTVQRLQAVGVQTVGEAWALPRDGFTRRHGAKKRLELDRLLGTEPDPRAAYIAPPTYARRLELLADTEDTTRISHAAIRLFEELAGFLRGRDCGTAELRLTLEHPRGESTPLNIGLRAVSRDVAQWQRLLGARLQSTALPAAVRALTLRTDDLRPLQQPQTSLFPTTVSGERRALLEQLGARLGPSRLYSVSGVADHRPEHAWCRSEPDGGHDTVGETRPRPLWLLRLPQPVEPAQLQLLSDPERLETGWWDGQLCRRDYYHARLRDGRYAWVFRDHDAQHWFIHGLCG